MPPKETYVVRHPSNPWTRSARGKDGKTNSYSYTLVHHIHRRDVKDTCSVCSLLAATTSPLPTCKIPTYMVNIERHVCICLIVVSESYCYNLEKIKSLKISIHKCLLKCTYRSMVAVSSDRSNQESCSVESRLSCGSRCRQVHLLLQHIMKF